MMQESVKADHSMNPTVQTVLIKAFSRHKAARCLVWEGGEASYLETSRRVVGLATWLQDTTPRNSHVAILLANGREFIETFIACVLAGRVRIPLNVREPVDVQVHKLRHAETDVLVTDAAWWETLRDAMGEQLPSSVIVGTTNAGNLGYEELVATSGSFEGLMSVPAETHSRLSFTGGTTGTIKATVQTQGRELALVRNILLEVIRPTSGTVFVAGTPMSHASGGFILPTLVGGGALSWTTSLDAERLVDAGWLGDDFGIQTFLVPTALQDVSEASRAGAPSIDTIVYGGAPASQQVLDTAIEHIGPRLVQVFGQAEAPLTVCVLSREHHRNPAGMAGCVGFPFLYVDVRVESGKGPKSVGEVLVRGDHVMRGYWRNEEATAEVLRPDGYLRTQDLGYFDETGRLWLSGRTREIVISGGYNVFLPEVERRLGSVAGVRKIALFGVPHGRWGEAVVAAAVPAMADASQDEIEHLVSSVAKHRLAYYERPKAVLLIDDLPQTAVGKISRRQLSDRFTALFDSESAISGDSPEERANG